MSGTHYPPYWKERTCQGVGAKPHAENLRFLDAWGRAEGGTAKWNPLNSTFDLPGVTLYNQHPGVKNYPRPTWGIAATVLTLTGPAIGPLRFPLLLGHLQAAVGTYTAEQITEDCALELGEWGTDPGLILEVLAG